MNPTREKAFDAAMEFGRRNGFPFNELHSTLDYVLRDARRIQSFLDGTESNVESGADAEATADLVGFPEMDETVVVGGNAVMRVVYPAPTPAADDGIVVTGPGAAATTNGAEGPPTEPAGETSHATKERIPRKPRKAKKAKAKREKKAKAAKPGRDKPSQTEVEPTVAESLNDEVPHTMSEAMDEAA